jgi:hypothetical protein
MNVVNVAFEVHLKQFIGISPIKEKPPCDYVEENAP